jgi:catechol 2,3-dioxygenase-like lactoylglutathione lyase family enzyme
MEQRVSLITLGVADLPRAVAFYAALGWAPGNDWQAQEVAFFQCGGMVVALWDRDELARDSGTTANAPGAVTLAWNGRSPAEVDAVLAEARAAGATIVRDGAETFWGGYSGAFLDPDGHPWEVAHNPHWTVAEDGAVTI